MIRSAEVWAAPRQPQRIDGQKRGSPTCQRRFGFRGFPNAWRRILIYSIGGLGFELDVFCVRGVPLIGL